MHGRSDDSGGAGAGADGMEEEEVGYVQNVSHLT